VRRRRREGDIPRGNAIEERLGQIYDSFTSILLPGLKTLWRQMGLLIFIRVKESNLDQNRRSKMIMLIRKQESRHHFGQADSIYTFRLRTLAFTFKWKGA
jgi:hypothetical protein